MARRAAAERDARRSVGLLEGQIGWLIKAVAVGIVVVVGSFQLVDTPLRRITEIFDGHSFIVIGLSLWFAGLAAGAGSDTKIIATGVQRDPELAKLGAPEYLGIGAFAVALSAVLLLHAVPVAFQIALCAFIATNVWTWRIILRRMAPMIEETRTVLKAESDSESYLRLAMMMQYMNGSWQRKRFAALFVFGLLQIGLALLDRFGATQAVIGRLNFFGVPGGEIAGYATGIAFLIWVATSELWMKLYRIRFHAEMRALDYVSDHFSLEQAADESWPAIIDWPWKETQRRSSDRNYA